MSKAKPVEVISAAAALATGPLKNLNPHCVSHRPGAASRAAKRNAAAPIRRKMLCLASTTESGRARDPTTADAPPASSVTASSNAFRSVAMSASQKPTYGAWLASRPARTAAPFPRASHRTSRTGTGPAGQSLAMSAVLSVLPLSTTMTATPNGRVAAFAQSFARPSGSRAASFLAGTMISSRICSASDVRLLASCMRTGCD
jgi:hypothetical protein